MTICGFSAHWCDVGSEDDVLGFRDEVLRDHGNLLFNNTGIGGAFSFLDETNRAGWERTFNICW